MCAPPRKCKKAFISLVDMVVTAAVFETTSFAEEAVIRGGRDGIDFS